MVFVSGDREHLAIGKFECLDVDRKPDGMGAELATRLIVAVAAHAMHWHLDIQRHGSSDNYRICQ